MSDITRWKVSGPTTRLQPDADGPWVALVDYYRAIDRLIAQRDAAQAEVERLKEQVAALTLAVEQADEAKADAEAAAAAEEAETDRVTCERDVAQAEVQRLMRELGGRSATNQQLTAERNAAQVEVERLKNAIDHLTSERDEAQAERDLAQRERERVQGLLWLRGRELPTLQRDQSAQNLDMGSGQAILDSSRPTDEDIWREVFFRCVSEYITGEKRVIIADTMLAEYRKRWPR